MTPKEFLNKTKNNKTLNVENVRHDIKQHFSNKYSPQIEDLYRKLENEKTSISQELNEIKSELKSVVAGLANMKGNKNKELGSI